MINEIKNEKDRYLNTSVFVDYENLFEKLEEYDTTPLLIDFFKVIKLRLREKHNLNVIDFVAYCNFEKNKLFQASHQTALQSFGIQTRHTSNNGKNSADLELTVDALKTLYKNSNIEVFVIISNDRDNIPLIKTIKGENKIAYVISTKNGFNTIVCEYADFHEYIEDIFNLDISILDKNKEKIIAVDETIVQKEDNIARAKEVSKLYYSSTPYKAYHDNGNSVGVKGYISAAIKKLNRTYEEVLNDFKVANNLKYVELYHDDTVNELSIRDGENKSKIYE